MVEGENEAVGRAVSLASADEIAFGEGMKSSMSSFVASNGFPGPNVEFMDSNVMVAELAFSAVGVVGLPPWLPRERNSTKDSGVRVLRLPGLLLSRDGGDSSPMLQHSPVSDEFDVMASCWELFPKLSPSRRGGPSTDDRWASCGRPADSFGWRVRREPAAKPTAAAERASTAPERHNCATLVCTLVATLAAIARSIFT